MDKKFKVVTIVSTKGGSGKSSLALMLASGAVKKGLRVVCIDADRNPQLLEWRGRMERYDWGEDAAPVWPDKLSGEKISADLEGHVDRLNALEETVDLVIIDTRPGSYHETEDVAYCGDVILIPTRAAPADVECAEDTYRWMNDLRDAFPDNEWHPSIRLVLSDASKNVMEAMKTGSVDKLTEAEYQQVARIIRLPFLDSAVPRSKIIENMPIQGPLSVQMEAYGKKSNTRYRQRSVKSVLDISEALVDEVINLEGISNGS